MTVLGSPLATRRSSPSTAERMAAWRRRSHRIHALRRWLPRIAIGLLGFTMIWMTVRAAIALVVAADFQRGEVHMLNPKFLGRDEKGRPFSIIAQDAVRDPRRPDRVRLTAPILTLTNPGAQPTQMRARTGALDQSANRLDLVGDVVIEDGQGARFKSQHALVDTEGGDVRGDSAVEGVGPLGRITASAYSVTENGAHILFTGGVQSHVIAHIQGQAAPRPPMKPRL